MSEFAIELRDLRKSYRGKPALNGLTLEVPEGSIYGFLGRNGAGKSTTIKLIANAIKLDSGTALVFGKDVADRVLGVEVRSRIGLVTEDKSLYPYMSVEQVIAFTRSFFPKWREDLERRYLRMFELPLKRKSGELSKGMGAKLMLLLALSHEVDLLILDEPTDGLDPAATEQVLREIVSVSAEHGTTIFFSSHQLGEVEQIADYVAIVDRGRCAVSGSLDDLKARYQRVQVTFDREPPESPRWVDGVEKIQRNGRTVSLLASANAEAILAQARALPGASAERYPVTLKEIFLEHVGGD
jgi:ABC-2 type transport system ATP-binding protein